MSRLVPLTHTGQIQFFEQHLQPWTTNASAIGLTGPQVAMLSDLVETAREKYVEAEAARLASKIATQSLQNALELMNKVGSGCVQSIRGKADSTLDASVYSKALIPPPAAKTPSGIPNQPTACSAFIDDGGRVNLSWVGSTQYNTYFTIWRKLPGESGFKMIGTVGGKKWVDETVRAGTPCATYFIKAHRGTKISTASLQMNIIFGIDAIVA